MTEALSQEVIVHPGMNDLSVTTAVSPSLVCFNCGFTAFAIGKQEIEKVLHASSADESSRSFGT